jgi:hypothetical protein
MPVKLMALLPVLALLLGLGSPRPVQAQAEIKPREVVKRFVQAVHKKDMDTLFALSSRGAAEAEGRPASDVRRAHEEFRLATVGDPSLCPPESNQSLSCRTRTYAGNRVVKDVRLFIPEGCQWEVEEPEGSRGGSTVQVTVKVTYTPQAGLTRVRDLKGLVGEDAGVRPPIPPFFGDGWVTHDNPLFSDSRTKGSGYKFFIQYTRLEALSGQVVFHLFKDKSGWVVDEMEMVESKTVLGQPQKVDTSKK